jgi:hypothetical protein
VGTKKDCDAEKLSFRAFLTADEFSKVSQAA